jgi:AraC-like DNA-binding protein
MTIRRDSQPGIWLLEAFRGMGVDVNALLRTLPGETARLLEHPETITADDLNKTLLACEEQTGDTHFGLHLIESIELTAMGLYGYLLLNASTIGEFLSLAEHYYPIFYRSAVLEVSKQANCWRLVYRRSNLSAVNQRHDDEWTLGSFINTIRSRLGADWQPLRTTFQGPAPKDLKELQRIFGQDLSFNQPLNSFEVDAALLEMPLNDADPRLLQIIREQADELLHSYGETESVEAQLRLLIMKDLELGPPKADNIARQMGMSLSTFKRFLAKRDLGFRALRDSVVRELATRALAETDVQISQVAMQLGYSEVSAFNHAFLRLVGQSPRDYRRQVRSV